MSETDQQSDAYFEEHSAQTGRVISCAAYFDDAISEFLASYLELSQLQENALLRPMSTRNKVDLLGRLSNQFVDKASLGEMKRLLSEARSALDERNALVHGVPGVVDGKFALISWVGKGKLDPKPDEWPVQRVCRLAQRFIGLTDFFAELTTHFNQHQMDKEEDPRQEE